MRNLCVSGWVWVVAVGVLVFGTRPAEAFYWYGWPGSGAPPQHTLTPPGGGSNPGGSGSPGNGGTGTAPPDNGSGNPPNGQPVITPPGGGGSPTGSGPSTPEPTTALAAIAGLGVLGMRRGVRRLKSMNE